MLHGPGLGRGVQGVACVFTGVPLSASAGSLSLAIQMCWSCRVCCALLVRPCRVKVVGQVQASEGQPVVSNHHRQPTDICQLMLLGTAAGEPSSRRSAH